MPEPTRRGARATGAVGAVGDDRAKVLGEVRSLLAELGSPDRPVHLQSDLTALGIDSLAVVELHDRLERAFAVSLDELALAHASTPADWLAEIERARGTGSPHAGEVAAGEVTAGVAPRPAGEPWPEHASTLTEGLAWHVEAHRDLVTIRLLGQATGTGIGDAAGDATETISYGELSDEAHVVAAGLVAAGVRQGDRVAIMLPTSRAYFAVFLGVLLAGGTAVPIYPPARLSVLEAHLSRQSRLLNNAGAVALVTIKEAIVAGRLLSMQVPSLRTVVTAAKLSETGASERVRLPSPGPEAIALIQYTSGSTGDPKGVVLTHAQILANIAAMATATGVTSSDVFVSWLPLYHDMGLIAAWHATMLLGLQLVLMSPLAFLARPASWLEAMTRYAGTISAAPNFAYQSCADRVSDHELASLELSGWRIALNGSEPVSPLSIDRFVERFSSRGFSRAAMCPAYGLAEVGVGMAITPIGTGPHLDVVEREALQGSHRAVPASSPSTESVTVVGCGRPIPGYELKVLDPDGSGTELAERQEGAVVCRGPSATTGYFHNEPATKELWSGGWLHTGDLGYLADGELYLTGRAKDLIIRGGRNLHPEELELAIEELEGVHRHGVAVFSSPDASRGTERLVVVAETSLSSSERRGHLEAEISKCSIDVLGLGPDEVVLVAPGALLRTPSGKVRRSATRAAYLAGELGRAPAPLALQVARIALSSVRHDRRHLTGLLRRWSTAGAIWLVVALLALPLVVGVQLPISLRHRWRFAHSIGRLLLDLTGISLRVEGGAPAGERGAVLVANHASFIDAAALFLAAAEPVVFVASTDLGSHAPMGTVLRRLGCVFVDRGEAAKTNAIVEQLTGLLRDGHRVVLFPEGSIARAPELRPFHLGAFAAAALAGCPVVPVGICGTRDVVEPGSYLPARAPITVRFGSPISPTGGDFRAQLELRDAAAAAVARLAEAAVSR